MEFGGVFYLGFGFIDGYKGEYIIISFFLNIMKLEVDEIVRLLDYVFFIFY